MRGKLNSKMEIIVWVGFSQALFSGILTSSKEGKSISDKLLSAWLYLLAIEFLTFAIMYPNFIFLTNSFLLFNPALYLYTCSLTNPSFKIRWSQAAHLIPYLFFKISSWAIKEPQSFETFFVHDDTYWYRMLFGICGIISWVVYLTLTSIVLRRHRKQLRNEFSTIDMFKKIGWIMFIVIFYIMYCFSVFLWGLLNIIYLTNESITIFNYSVLLVFAYVFGFYGLKQRDIFVRKETNGGEEKNGSKLLSPSEAEKIRKKLLTYIEKEKPYLNPDLNMTFLSEKLKVQKHYLTEVLNKNIGKNFFQFVNEYRIDEVKKLLSDQNNPYSIEAIGYECGFNSKSTFFSVFKNITGQTPKEYQMSIKQENNNTV